MPINFRDAWAQVQRTGNIYNSTLFATSIYGPRQKNTLPQRPTTAHQTRYRQAPNPTVWKEYSGHSHSRTTGHSPILMEAQSRYAQSVFTRAEYTLSKLKEKW